MNILGVSAYYHDSAAALVRDGDIVAAAQEERFTRKKHDYRFPQNAIDYCLEEAQIGRNELDLVVFYDKPLLKFERILETYVSYSPSGFKLFLMGLPLWLKQKLYTPRELRKGLGGEYEGRFVFLEHHESHAASAFFPSPFEEAAILTMDGVGEWATGSIGVGRGNRVEMLKELRFPHSLGLLYSAFTYFTGFRVNSGEYKLMGLAPYGQPIYKDRIMDELLDLKEDGSFRMNMDYFAFCYNDRMTSSKIDELFEGPPRTSESEITQREMDIAASIQAVTEEIVLRMARHLREDVDEFFEMRPNEDSPYMLLVAPVRQDKRLEIDQTATGLDKLHQKRSVVPAITHVDCSARVQTVDSERHPRFSGILSAFKAKTGCPMLINTSFNVRGEPIVNTPEDAYHCFMGTNMDVLVVDNFVLKKTEQPNAQIIDRDAYLKQFALD